MLREHNNALNVLLLLLLQAYCGEHWPRRHGGRERDAACDHGEGE
jgi:hypothetical protein